MHMAAGMSQRPEGAAGALWNLWWLLFKQCEATTQLENSSKMYNPEVWQGGLGRVPGIRSWIVPQRRSLVLRLDSTPCIGRCQSLVRWVMLAGLCKGKAPSPWQGAKGFRSRSQTSPQG